jgi:hypothetical protein
LSPIGVTSLKGGQAEAKATFVHGYKFGHYRLWLRDERTQILTWVPWEELTKTEQRQLKILAFQQRLASKWRILRKSPLLINRPLATTQGKFVYQTTRYVKSDKNRKWVVIEHDWMRHPEYGEITMLNLELFAIEQAKMNIGVKYKWGSKKIPCHEITSKAGGVTFPSFYEVLPEQEDPQNPGFPPKPMNEGAFAEINKSCCYPYPRGEFQIISGWKYVDISEIGQSDVDLHWLYIWTGKLYQDCVLDIEGPWTDKWTEYCLTKQWALNHEWGHLCGLHHHSIEEAVPAYPPEKNVHGDLKLCCMTDGSYFDLKDFSIHYCKGCQKHIRNKGF